MPLPDQPDDPGESDAILVVRCQLGDRLAWDELIRRWHPRLWRFVAGMILDRAAAEDIQQTIWLRVVRSLVRVREPEKLTSWLFGIARTTIADRLRDQYRRPPPEPFAELSAPDAGFEHVDDLDLLDVGLRRLHPADREAVVLYYLEQYPLEEVARICDIPVGTVKSRLHRARREMREACETPGE